MGSLAVNHSVGIKIVGFIRELVKIVDNRLDFYFHSSFFILFCFCFCFLFLFLEQLGLGSIGHAVTSVTSGGIVT